MPSPRAAAWVPVCCWRGSLTAPVQWPSASQRVDTPEQARHWVDRYHAAGFQQMKIYSSVKLEEVKAVADEAHRLGMTVTGHVPNGLTAYQAIEAGQDQINHIRTLPISCARRFLPTRPCRPHESAGRPRSGFSRAQKALTFLKEHHTVVDPTIALFELFTATTAKPPASFEPGVDKVAPELAEQLTDVEPPNERRRWREDFSRKKSDHGGIASRRDSCSCRDRSNCSRL